MQARSVSSFEVKVSRYELSPVLKRKVANRQISATDHWLLCPIEDTWLPEIHYRPIVPLTNVYLIYRLHRLEEIANHWDGPMSLAIYLSDREAAILTEYLDSSPFFAQREDICIHLVFQEGVSWYLGYECFPYLELLSDQFAAKYRHGICPNGLCLHSGFWLHPKPRNIQISSRNG